MYTPQILTAVIKAGGGLIVRNSNSTPAILQSLAAEAAKAKVKLTIQVDIPVSVDILTSIAKAGNGYVIFDVRDTFKTT